MGLAGYFRSPSAFHLYMLYISKWPFASKAFNGVDFVEGRQSPLEYMHNEDTIIQAMTR